MKNMKVMLDNPLTNASDYYPGAFSGGTNHYSELGGQGAKEL